MKKIFLSHLNALFGKELELRVKLFHVLAITGVIICVTMTGVSIAGKMWASMVTNIGAGIVSFFLLIYSARKQRYKVCYGVSIAVIFFVLFPSLFFSGGGYKGGMPFFFVFAIVFTVYMLDGWSMVGVTLAEIVFYSYLCVVAYLHPEWVVPFRSEPAVITDVIIGLTTVGISLGATMFVQVWMYRRQQVELEQARQAAEGASRAKSAFLANMSHEIRTPIHMILGMNEIIHRESHSPLVREHSQKIEETGKMLLSLVDSVLDVSKIESGKMEVLPAVYESASLVRNLALIGRTNCQKKGLNFVLEADENLPAYLYGDLSRVRQIGTNFLSNAAKYTKSGRVVLKIWQEASAHEGQIDLCISVEDTGIGIKKEAFSTLFDAFSRTDLAAHRDIQGTGLGLAIVKELAHLMGGRISLESEPGKGSTFTARIPQTVPEERFTVDHSREMSFLAPQVHILVVDDNEENRTILQELLKPTQVVVDTADSGITCLELVRKNAYHLILMDYMMPQMDGLQTMGELKKIPGFSVPVIALTADATPETRHILMEAGFRSYLTKPIPWSRLKDALVACLPTDLVQMVSAEKTEAAGADQKIQKLLEPYGIYPEEAMQFFDGSQEQYCHFADIFLRHEADKQNKVRSLWNDKNYPTLRISIHTLKGKAKNLGMVRLSEVCAYTERLIQAERYEELDSILPYLFYLWKQGILGIRELLKNQQPKTETSAVDNWETCMEALPQMLQELRRKPSLACIGKLLQGEQDEQGKQMLQHIRQLVDEISFDEAEAEFAAYRKWKDGGNKQ